MGRYGWDLEARGKTVPRDGAKNPSRGNPVLPTVLEGISREVVVVTCEVVVVYDSVTSVCCKRAR